ncbi:MAG TPA: cytochrome c oxidase subunit II [Candidatus Acidoferrum sp.]|jgi:cytochrome c oxidase subunit 2|nr:cytochrome c oxidase subunit II [Candidatus Acidoferrum sp.]
MNGFTEWWAKILNMPPLASSNGQDVDNLIIYVHWLMLALFIGWIIYFVYAVWRFHHKRNPKADYHGVRNHASNYIELTVAGIEAVLLIFVAVPLWAKAVDKFPPANQATVIQLVAQQYAWNFRYPGPDGVFGRQDMRFVNSTNIFGVDPTDPNGKDDIQLLNEMHVPIGKPVIVYVSSKDVIHSFKIIAMRVCQDAIPGLRIPVWFTPTQIGRYQINCAQLCGPGHSSMTGGFVTVDSQADYDKWLRSKSPAASSASFE